MGIEPGMGDWHSDFGEERHCWRYVLVLGEWFGWSGNGLNGKERGIYMITHFLYDFESPPIPVLYFLPFLSFAILLAVP